MGKTAKKTLRRGYGYVLVLVLAYAWLGASMGAGVIALLSGMLMIYSLFVAPVWCCAENRDGGYCRDNAYGVLMGCYRRQHKWQKLHMAVRYQYWGRLCRRVLSGVGGQAASLSAVAGTVSATVALGTFVFK
jgi:hypothetical protein